MGAHTITTKAPIRAEARMTQAIVPSAILTLSLAVALMAATASTASAERALSLWYCPPLTPPATDVGQVLGSGCLGRFSVGPSFEFGDRQVGTTSPVQRFALGVYCYPGSCNETLNPSIAVPGDYAQTNNCPATLSAAAPGQLQGCIIDVTFTPTGTGPRVGALSTGPGGPTFTLTGNGVTTPTPPVLPLLLSSGYPGRETLRKRLSLSALTNNDSTVVARGGVKRTVVRLAAGDYTMFKAKLKHLKRLKDSRKPRVKIKFAATDEFGQEDTVVQRIKFCTWQQLYCGL